MTKTRSAILRLTDLERREVPAGLTADGWADAANLTLSFAGDGTPIGDARSNLQRTFDRVADRAVWQREVLRGFQTWAVQTNINIGLVGDGRLPFGTPGEFQGDTRFGDIRVGGRPLSGDELASAAEVNWLSGTWAGDVVFNTARPFALGPPPGSAAADLFTIALHEAGHALGLGHSDDSDSAVATHYTSAQNGLSATDVAAIQSAHGGPRRPDRHEGPLGNGSPSTATPLPGAGPLVVVGDLTTTSDVDTYRFTASDGRFTVRVGTSGLSLLTARVTVTDALGRVVGADESTDPMNGDLEVVVDRATSGGTYFVRVEGATADVFRIGRYSLAVTFGARSFDGGGLVGFVRDGGANDTPAGATDLDAGPLGALGLGSRFQQDGVIEGRGDVDHYRVTAPPDLPVTASAMVIQVRSMRAGRAAPALAVFDEAGNPVPVVVLSDTGDHRLVQVLGVRAGGSFILRLAGDGTDAAVGNYCLAVDFVAPPVDVSTDRERLAAGYLSPGGVLTGTLHRESSGLYQFRLGSAEGDDDLTVTLTVTDAAGRVVFTLTLDDDDSAAAGSVYLEAGSYTFTLTMAGPADANLWAMLDGEEVSDPAGTYGTSTSTFPSGGSGRTSGSGGTTTTAKTTTSTSTTVYSY